MTPTRKTSSRGLATATTFALAMGAAFTASERGRSARSSAPTG